MNNLVPVAVAAPAVAAAVAYINAKASVWNDIRLLDHTFTSLSRVLFRQRVDRLNLFYLLEGLAQSRSHGNKELLLFEGKRYTYASAYDRVLRYGTWMKEALGVKPGDIVAMNFQNSDTFVFVWFGLWSIGAKPAFINYNLTGNALTHCIKVATTKLCLVDPAVVNNVTDDIKQQVPDVNFVVLTPELEAEAATAPATRSPNEDRSQTSFTEMAILIYTSGTTGMPKPAIVSWGKCITGAGIADRVLKLGARDTLYTVSVIFITEYPISLALMGTGHAFVPLCRSCSLILRRPPRWCHPGPGSQVLHAHLLGRCAFHGRHGNPVRQAILTLYILKRVIW